MTWPDTVRSVMVFLSSLGDLSMANNSAIHCSTVGDLSVADIHYATLSIAVTLPFVICLISWLYWFIIVPKVPVLGCNKKLHISRCKLKKNPFARSRSDSHNHNHWKSTRDGWIATNVYIVYIVFPSIVRMSFETFQMQKICGIQYLAMDDTEIFDGERRIFFADYVALPALLLYMLVLPVLIIVYLWKQHSVIFTNRKIVFRFGLLYSGYAKDRWYWEIFVVARKIVMIIIVTFGRSNKMQLHLASGVLTCILYLQERGKPFEEQNPSMLLSVKEKKQHRMLHLSEISSLVVLLVMVWVAVFFNVSTCSQNWECVVLSLLVFCSNLLFVAMCSYAGCRAFIKTNKTIASMSKLIRKISAGKNHTSPPSSNDQVLTDVSLNENPLENGRQRWSLYKTEQEVELVVANNNNFTDDPNVNNNTVLFSKNNQQ